MAETETYQHSNQYKKQKSTHNKWGKLAATQNTVLETAHYANQILQQDEFTKFDHTNYSTWTLDNLPRTETSATVADESGWLAQGNSDTGIKGTDTMFSSTDPKYQTEENQPTYEL